MSEFVNVETASLEGRALDWAVAIVEGWQPDRPQDGQLKSNGLVILVGTHKPDSTKRFSYSPSTSWICGGPLIDKYQPCLIPEAHDGMEGTECSQRWMANIYYNGGEEYTTSYCDTALVAVCRAVVATEFGDTVSVPAALLEVAP